MTNKNNATRIRIPGARTRGFSVAGAMVGILILGAVTAGGAFLYTDYKQDQVAQARGRQLGTGLEQLDRFARKYQAQLTSGTAIAGVASAYAPTPAELQALGFAAPGFSDATQPGGALVFQIAREPAGCLAAKCILSLKAATSGSIRVNGVASAPFAQRIAGYVPNGAGWSNLATDATKLGKNGYAIANPVGNAPAIVAAVAWLGNGNASQTVPPPTTNYSNIACPAGYSGSGKDQHQTVTTDKWGNTTTSSWVTDSYDCTADPPPPPPSCANGATDYPTCTLGSGSASDPPPPAGVCTNGATNYPSCTFTCPNGASNYPTCTSTCPNGASNYPTCTFACANGATNYPTCTFTCANGAANYPACTFTCANGAPNYPTCTFTCANGAPNYPTCTFTCANGATNYPTCTLPTQCPPEGTYCDTWGGSDGSLWEAPPMGYGKIIYSGPQCKATYIQLGTYMPVNGCPV